MSKDNTVSTTTTTETPKPRIQRRNLKPAPATITRLNKSATGAVQISRDKAKQNEDVVLTTLEEAANKGLAKVREICAKASIPDGLSALGHKLNCQNGEMDRMILTYDSFDQWITETCKVGCPSRRSDLKDNEAFVKRLQSHLKFVSGRKASGQQRMPRDLDKVGLGDKAVEIMNALKPVSQLFDEYKANGKF